MRITETFGLCYFEVGVQVADFWFSKFEVQKWKRMWVKTPYNPTVLQPSQAEEGRQYSLHDRIDLVAMCSRRCMQMYC